MKRLFPRSLAALLGIINTSHVREAVHIPPASFAPPSKSKRIKEFRMNLCEENRLRKVRQKRKHLRQISRRSRQLNQKLARKT